MGVKATTRNRVWASLVVVVGVGLGAAAFLRAKPAPVAPPAEEQAQPAARRARSPVPRRPQPLPPRAPSAGSVALDDRAVAGSVGALRAAQ